MVNNWWRLQRKLPAGSCLLCAGAASRLVCRGCHTDLPRLTQGCSHCALPLPQAGICPDCQRRPPPYRALAACRYEYPVSRLIQRFKFHGQPGLGRELAALMLEQPPAFDPADTCLLPVPLHWWRQIRRGFNQATALALPLASGLGLPLQTHLACRVKPTRPQTVLQGRQRQHNVGGAFRARADIAPPGHVIIVDDVMTSGHTATALARCLRRAGVRMVTVWTFARAGISDIKRK